ncbi:MAG: KH domain-containing protein [Clostridiaceae bacterium]|nr:KH domain-containing protein [Clostridiaceae bacterium]
MKELLSTIVRPLVSDPDAISINQIDQGYTIVLELQVAPEDMGKVIGKQGRRAQAIRSIMKAKATLTGKRVIVDIIG